MHLAAQVLDLGARVGQVRAQVLLRVAQAVQLAVAGGAVHLPLLQRLHHLRLLRLEVPTPAGRWEFHGECSMTRSLRLRAPIHKDAPPSGAMTGSTAGFASMQRYLKSVIKLDKMYRVRTRSPG